MRKHKLAGTHLPSFLFPIVKYLDIRAISKYGVRGVQNPIRDTNFLADLFCAKNVLICIFEIHPCSGGVNLENWTIF